LIFCDIIFSILFWNIFCCDDVRNE
jgi:hypothetical protein